MLFNVGYDSMRAACLLHRPLPSRDRHRRCLAMAVRVHTLGRIVPSTEQVDQRGQSACPSRAERCRESPRISARKEQPTTIGKSIEAIKLQQEFGHACDTRQWYDYGPLKSKMG
jgi:hypothetical protein